MMKVVLLMSVLVGLALTIGAQQPPKKVPKVFPYAYTIDDLPNGLRLVTVPTDYPNLVALYIVVNTGSRNEIEPGKSGYAHLFEHMMFRGSQNYTPDQRDAILKRAGASSNAYTSDDRTVYHEVFAKEDLDEILKLEADRFLRLKYGPDVYRTETQAVRGEYNKNSANPFSKLYEKLRETAFNKHTYKHTTMGFLKDIEDMPNQYDYSLEFYRRYYRPEYTTIVLVGDVTRERALALVKQYFGAWKRGNYTPQIPAEPEQKAPRTAHVEWPAPTLPHLAIAFRGPAFSVENKDKAALDLLAAIAFGQNSELYERLVLREQKVDVLAVSFDNKLAPELFTVFARVKDPQEVSYVRDQILATFQRYTKELVPQQKLDATRSRLRYSAALAMNSSEAIASALAPFITLGRTPETIDKLFALYERISQEDIRKAAAQYLVEEHRTIVTLAHEPPSQEKAKGGQK
jgi:zinc protease